MTDIERIDQQIARSYFDDEFELMHTKAMLFDFAKWKNEEVKKFLVSLCEIGSHMDMCNSVIVYKHDNAELVSLYFMPNYDRHDKNNIYFGNCTFDDIMNIEKIIENRKAYYAEQQTQE